MCICSLQGPLSGAEGARRAETGVVYEILLLLSTRKTQYSKCIFPVHTQLTHGFSHTSVRFSHTAQSTRTSHKEKYGLITSNAIFEHCLKAQPKSASQTHGWPRLSEHWPAGFSFVEFENLQHPLPLLWSRLPFYFILIIFFFLLFFFGGGGGDLCSDLLSSYNYSKASGRFLKKKKHLPSVFFSVREHSTYSTWDLCRNRWQTHTTSHTKMKLVLMQKCTIKILNKIFCFCMLLILLRAVFAEPVCVFGSRLLTWKPKFCFLHMSWGNNLEKDVQMILFDKTKSDWAIIC